MEKDSKDDKIVNNDDNEDSCELGPLTPQQRSYRAYRIRKAAAIFEKEAPLLDKECNTDEFRSYKKIGNHSKALPHNKLGEVDIRAYNALIKALSTGCPKYFEEIPLGGETKLANPQASYAYELIGGDPQRFYLEAPPSFSSSKTAAEMIELYWMALARDINFNEYLESNLILDAAKDLSLFLELDGPIKDGKVTPDTIFRGITPDDLIGPYISQFLYMPIPYGPKTVEQTYKVPLAKDDYLFDYDEWLNIQNGNLPKSGNSYDSKLRHIRNGRDLGEYVHRDFSFQSILNAALILLSFGKEALALSNPYVNSKTQVGFSTFGGPHILDFIALSTKKALKASWCHKWLVHRRLRPEEFGGRIHNLIINKAFYPINRKLQKSDSLDIIYKNFKSFLLPLAYPEGCPTHPAYPAGHAALAGAGVTMLKALFNENYVLTNPVIPDIDGLKLEPYVGPELTIGGELNKLASNISLGRNFPGVHWRSDGISGMILGEEVAIRILQDYKNTFNENFEGFSFTKFDGTSITI